MPHKRSHAAQSADHRLSRYAGTDTHGPAAQPAIFPVHQLPHSLMALLSNPAPKAKPDTPHAFPPHRHRPTRPSRPACYLSRHQLPHSRMALLSKPCSCPQSEARHAPHFPTTQAQTHTPQPPSPLSSPLTNSPIPAHLSSSSDPYKNPGSRPPPGFFVISGSVRSPSQRRLR